MQPHYFYYILYTFWIHRIMRRPFYIPCPIPPPLSLYRKHWPSPDMLNTPNNLSCLTRYKKESVHIIHQPYYDETKWTLLCPLFPRRYKILAFVPHQHLLKLIVLHPLVSKLQALFIFPTAPEAIYPPPRQV